LPARSATLVGSTPALSEEESAEYRRSYAGQPAVKPPVTA
jgi:hypothetical protein